MREPKCDFVRVRGSRVSWSPSAASFQISWAGQVLRRSVRGGEQGVGGSTTLMYCVDTSEPAANPLAHQHGGMCDPALRSAGCGCCERPREGCPAAPPCPEPCVTPPSCALPKHLPVGHQSWLVPEMAPSSASANKGQGGAAVSFLRAVTDHPRDGSHSAVTDQSSNT